MMSCSRHYENASPFLAKQQQWLRNRCSIEEKGSKVAYFLFGAGTVHGAPPL